MLARLGIRLVSSLAGIALGLVLSAEILKGFSIDATGLVWATLVFWGVHILVSFVALRVLVRQPSVAMAGLLSLASTVVALIIVNIFVSGVHIHGLNGYLGATLIIWLTTAAADFIGRRKIRARRQDRRD